MAVHMYGCGGMGLNIVSNFINIKSELDVVELLEIKTSFIDTSASNIGPKAGTFNKDSISILAGLDGSGKLRKENSGVIADNIKQLLIKHKPEDFNIVVFSASGGSGSVIGPLLIKEMLHNKQLVVAVVLGSEESLITTSNTINTFKSLESVSNQVEQPVVVFYRQMHSLKDRKIIDDEICWAIGYLIFLNSKNILELDRMDLNNWLYYNRVTSVQPTLTALEIFNGDSDSWNTKSPISVATVCTAIEYASCAITPEYQCCGYTNSQLLNNNNINALHFVTDADLIREQIKKVQKKLVELNNYKDSRIKSTTLLSDTDNVQNGLIL